MKISLAWLWDHIDADWNSVDIAHIVDLLNRSTAEIEQYHHIFHDPHQYTLVQVQQVAIDAVDVYSPEHEMSYQLLKRSDLQHGDLALLIRNEQGIYRWADMSDLGCNKGGYVPSLFCAPDQISGGWRASWEAVDYILDIDNKSINHRPDLWGHRGIAREVAALLDLPLKPLHMLLPRNSISIAHARDAATDGLFSYAIKTDQCPRLAALYVQQISYVPSLLWMAHRLMRVHARPMQAVIDMTNYVMFDISQPMHAFDADTIKTKSIIVKTGSAHEQLRLLDNQQITVQPTDVIVSDTIEPISLAGIMGGKQSGVTQSTKNLLLESVHVCASTIRRTSQRLGLRTEASARFEKTLDILQNETALLRYVRLLEDASMSYTITTNIVSLGERPSTVSVQFSHEYVERMLGVSIDILFVEEALKKLEFHVVRKDDMYYVDVPSFRSSKDVQEGYDVVEEIARLYGFSNIVPQLPTRAARVYDYDAVYRLRDIKKYFAYSAHMRELYSYAFYDEFFLQQWGWKATGSLQVQDPVSEHYTNLVTSLLPNLIKAVQENIHGADQLRFFEAGRVWNCTDTSYQEDMHIAGVIYDKHDLNFYQMKDIIVGLCDLLKLTLSWQLVEDPQERWFTPCQTARLVYQDRTVGMFGVYNQSPFKLHIPGHMILFWLDQSFLQTYRSERALFVAESKFPVVERDVSIFIATTYSVAQVEQIIAQVDERIINVTLLDFFQKKEWVDKRAMTFRYTISDQTKTLTKQEIDFIVEHVNQHLSQQGAEIR